MFVTDHLFIDKMAFLLAFRQLVVVAGLVICLRNRWLSQSMWLIAGALAAMLAISGGQFSMGTLLDIFGFSGLGTEIRTMIFVFQVAELLALIVLVIGFALVLKDVRERFQRLRELHETDPAEPDKGFR